MKLSKEQLLKAGVRSAEPTSECKGYKGWIAKARFRLTDQEIMILDVHYFYHSRGKIKDDQTVETYIDHETEIKPIATEEGFMGSYQWKRKEASRYRNDSEDINNNPPDIERAMTLSFGGFIRNRERGTDGFMLVTGIKTKAAIQILMPRAASVINLSLAIQKNHWWIFMGDPDDLDKLYHWHQKNYGYAFSKTEITPRYYQAIDINPDQENGYCSRGIENETGTIYGTVCRFDNELRIESFNKIIQPMRNGNPCRLVRRSMQLGAKDPWSEGPRWHEQTFYLNFPKDPDLTPLHKKGQNFTQSTTDNVVGLPGTDVYDTELYVSRKQMVRGVEVEVPDERISARLHQVQFWYCGCNERKEIECLGPDDEVCCIDCCKIGEFVTSLF